MWKTLKTITQMMSPVLSYTAEEIWQKMREMDPSLPKSVFLTDWPEALGEGLDPSVESLWDSIMNARQGVLRGLEAARSKGVIGHPLDAHVQIKLSDYYKELAGKVSDETWEMALIVSSCETVDEVKGAEVVYEDETTGLVIGVDKSKDEKARAAGREGPRSQRKALQPLQRCYRRITGKK